MHRYPFLDRRFNRCPRRGGPSGLAMPIFSFSLSSLEPKSLRMVILIIILVQVLCCHLITKITRNGINGAMFVTLLLEVFNVSVSKGNQHPDTSDHLKSSKLVDPLLTDFVFLLSWPPFMISFMCHNLGSTSEFPLRSLNHKISSLNPIYPMRSIQSKFLTPKREVLEEES